MLGSRFLSSLGSLSSRLIRSASGIRSVDDAIPLHISFISTSRLNLSNYIGFGSETETESKSVPFWAAFAGLAIIMANSEEDTNSALESLSFSSANEELKPHEHEPIKRSWLLRSQFQNTYRYQLPASKMFTWEEWRDMDPEMQQSEYEIALLAHFRGKTIDKIYSINKSDGWGFRGTNAKRMIGMVKTLYCHFRDDDFTRGMFVIQRMIDHELQTYLGLPSREETIESILKQCRDIAIANGRPPFPKKVVNSLQSTYHDEIRQLIGHVFNRSARVSMDDEPISHDLELAIIAEHPEWLQYDWVGHYVHGMHATGRILDPLEVESKLDLANQIELRYEEWILKFLMSLYTPVLAMTIDHKREWLRYPRVIDYVMTRLNEYPNES